MACRPQDGFSLQLACGSYCNSVTAACTNSGGVDNRQYASKQDCLDLCQKPTWNCGTPDDITGNSIWCRTNFSYNIEDDPSLAATDCPKAGPNSTACQ
jgi:hypothetical protein